MCLNNKTFQRIYQISISCFLIDMKFISMIMEILINQCSSFSGAHLHKIGWQWDTKNGCPNFQMFKVFKNIFQSSKQINPVNTFVKSNSTIPKGWVHQLSNTFEILNSQIYKKQYFRKCVHNFLICCEVFLVYLNRYIRVPRDSQIHKSWKC